MFINKPIISHLYRNNLQCRMNIGEMFVSPNLEMQHIDDTSFTFGWVLKALNEMDHDWINISSGRKVKNVCA
uniref:Uncharacterized protein n=1 Tax=Ascaris lumbricoides TaxID=6252 RepID=A0A0M3HIQ1_ASCLU